jgi:hypothetical protein
LANKINEDAYKNCLLTRTRVKQTNKHTNKQTNKQANKQKKNLQTNKQKIYKETNSQKLTYWKPDDLEDRQSLKEKKGVLVLLVLFVLNVFLIFY